MTSADTVKNMKGGSIDRPEMKMSEVTKKRYDEKDPLIYRYRKITNLKVILQYF
jgi:hypothetical protein